MPRPARGLLPPEEARNLEVLGVVRGGALDGDRLPDGPGRGRRGHGARVVIRQLVAAVDRLGPLALEFLEEVALPRRPDRRRGVDVLARRRRPRLALAGAVETGRDDRDHHLVAEALVEARPEDDVRL